MKAIGLELYKLRHKHLFLMTGLFLLVEIAWAFMSSKMSISRNPDYNGWELIIAVLSSMNGLFLPILSAICVSRICDMEHKGNTWKLLLTVSVRRGELYKAKFIAGTLVMLWGCALQIGAILLFGMINNIEQPVPFLLLMRFFIGIMITNMTILALQQWVSMAVKNQAFALALGMIGGFIGMAGELFPSQIRSFFIWSYYTRLCPVTQSYTNEKIQFLVRDIGSLLPVIVGLSIAGIGIYMAGCIHVSKQEV